MKATKAMQQKWRDDAVDGVERLALWQYANLEPRALATTIQMAKEMLDKEPKASDNRRILTRLIDRFDR